MQLTKRLPLNMHYYPHHIGDYQRDTAHLSVTEHGVYRLLLDHCYATERPLPADHGTLCRIIRANSKSERDAIATVTAQFFQATPDGLTHKRVAEEITEYARLKERNRTNGQKGGKPKKGKPPPTHSKPSGLADGSGSLTQTKANQEPIANSQVQTPNPPEPPASPSLDGFSLETVEPEPKVWTPNEQQLTVARWFNRRETTQWSDKERRAWKAANPQAPDIALLASYYTAEIPKQWDYRRRDLLTLLNNWPGELDRARRFTDSQDDRPTGL